MEWIIAAVLLIFAGGIIAMLSVTVPIAKNVYKEQLVRTEPEKWGRVCSCPENEEQQAMWDAGCAWAASNADKKQDVHIVHDSLNLYGEFYRFSDSGKCVIILPGRCECLKYSYYFAPAYERSGYNVLVIDTRAHGNSDGKYNTIGAKESGDVLAWVRMLEESFGIDTIYFHTICVGTASGLLAMTDKACPDSVKGIVTEGCFTSFRETFKQHMIQINKPLFPVLDLVMYQITKNTGTNLRKTAPIKVIGKLKQRALFLYGEQDVFSLPEKSKQLFNKCGSSDKRIVWFDKGGHSHLRINNTEKYDQAIVDFLNDEK